MPQWAIDIITDVRGVWTSLHISLHVRKGELCTIVTQSSHI